MMKMKKFEEFVDGLKQQVDIPDKVWFKCEDTLESVDSYSIKGRRWKNVVKVAVIAGVAIIGFSAFCINNPVIAAKIPIIGNIFKQIEKDVPFSGNYTDADKVQDTDSAKTTAVSEKGIAVAESNGIKITASEVYNDGYSIYLTMKVDMKNGQFTHVSSYASDRFGETYIQGLYTEGEWKTSDMDKTEMLVDNKIEGKADGDDTFIGMIKLDRESYSIKDGKLIINFTQIGYDDDRAETDDIGIYKKIKGEWNLEIPYTVDTVKSKIVDVNKKNKDGFGVKKVFVSPYQIIVFKDGPEPKNEEEDGYVYAYSEVAVYNDKGQYMQWEKEDGDDNSKEIFAVKGKDVSKLHIYMTTDEDHMFEAIKSTKKEEAAKIADFDVEVDTYK